MCERREIVVDGTSYALGPLGEGTVSKVHSVESYKKLIMSATDSPQANVSESI